MNCMCDIYQKFYSSLKNLDSISINNVFFDNISCFDSFFSEFRSITFTLQSSFKHNEKAMHQYDLLKDKYLLSDNMKWCNDTRVDVTHKKPFQLNKIVDVDLYYMDKSRTKIHHKFDLAINDMSLKEITNEITKELSLIETVEPEIYFTINYYFIDSKKNINVFNNINEIISNMNTFLIEFDKNIQYDCENCELLKNKISDVFNRIIVKNIEFQKDGVFEVKSKKISFGSTAIFAFGSQENTIISNPKISIKDNPLLKGRNINDFFASFISFHLLVYILQKKHIMPTFFIFFEDETFTIKSFLFDNKATFYKQINKIANTIESKKIIAIFLVNEMYGYNEYSEDTMNLPYDERIKHSSIEYLSFSMITSNLQEKYYLINTNEIINEKSIGNISSNLEKYKTDCIITALNPIKLIFQKKKKSSNQ